MFTFTVYEIIEGKYQPIYTTNSEEDCDNFVDMVLTDNPAIKLRVDVEEV